MSRLLCNETAATLEALPVGSMFRFGTDERWYFLKRDDGEWAGYLDTVYSSAELAAVASHFRCPKEWALVEADPRNAEIARLREALAPFVRLHVFKCHADDHVFSLLVTVGDIRRAKAALEGAT